MTRSSLRALGIVAEHEEDLPQARTYYEASLVICHEIDDPRGLSACLGNLGSICRRQGDFGAAQAFLEQSLAIHRALGNRSSEGRTLSHLGELSADLEEYAQAERFFAKALHLLRAIGEAHHAAAALTALGNCTNARANPRQPSVVGKKCCRSIPQPTRRRTGNGCRTICEGVET